jgi:hypothetical protein
MARKKRPSTRLDRDVHWLTSEEFYGDKPCPFTQPLYLVLTSGDDLFDLLWTGPPGAPVHPDSERLRAEFDTIVDRHGFFVNFDEGMTACFLSKDDEKVPSETEKTISEMLKNGRRWSDNQKHLLIHPDDDSLNARYDFFADELQLSPKLVDRLKQLFENDDGRRRSN